MSTFQAKIADYGASKISETNIFKTIQGSPAYMAPEILGGLVGRIPQYDKSVDIFSYAVMVFEMLYDGDLTEFYVCSWSFCVTACA